MSYRLNDRQRLDWLRLIRSENVGPRTFAGLMRRYGNAATALEALPGLARRGGATRPPVICSLAAAEAEFEKAGRSGVRFVAVGEADYPPDLREISDAPPLLAVAGQAAALLRPMVAIVGARNASALGLKFAELIAGEIGAAGFVIASGLARGVDAAAHRASLATGTVAALAGGHLQIYPSENVALARQISEAGALISEMPIDFVPRGQDFPRRNRLVAGLSRAVVVIEAAARSGSLTTARMANEQGREVFAAPGSPLDPRSEGTNRLIQSGATLVMTADDVLSALKLQIRAPLRLDIEAPDPPDWPDDADTQPDSTPEDLRHRILDLLGPAPAPVDDLIRLSGGAPGPVRAILLELELAGRIDDHGPAGVARRS